MSRKSRSIPRSFDRFCGSSYGNLSSPLRRCSDEFTCCHPGVSCETMNCPCFRNRTTCREKCYCSGNGVCKRRLPGCSCTDGCGHDCTCVKFGHNCRLTQCACVASSKCGNFPPLQSPPPVVVGTSSIHGFGLFACQAMKKGTYLGEYLGRVASDDAEVKSMDFRISSSKILIFRICSSRS